MKKKVLSLLLILGMMATFVPFTQINFPTVSAASADSDFISREGVLIEYIGDGGDITIPSFVTSIGEYAFAFCKDLTSVTIPNTVTDIGEGAFFGCVNLQKVIIPNTITSISDGAFFGCTRLTGLTIPNSVKSIGESAFEGCECLTSITIPNSVTSIGSFAFSLCSLTSVTIPNSVTSIGYYAFGLCEDLKSINVSGQNSHYSSQDGILFNKNKTEIIIFPCAKSGKYVIPSSVTSIGDYAFEYCEGLTGVTIPSSVKSIGEGAFSSCIGLTSVTIPNSVTSIGDFAFSCCEDMTSITIGSSVNSIGDFAFDECTSLKNIYYNGSEEDWNKIRGDFRDSIESVTVHYNGGAKAEIKITAQPTSVVAKNNAWITFNVKASGDGLTYQWQLSDDQGKTWRNSSIKTANYSTTLNNKNNGRYVRCIVTDKYGSKVTSNSASMKITSLKITTQPSTYKTQIGGAVWFKVAASGDGLTYQWQLSDNQGKTWRNSSVKTANYSTTLSSKNNGRYVRCIVTDKYGNKVTSDSASMRISSPSSINITRQPANFTAEIGGAVWFKVAASGEGLTYQWQLSDDQGKTWRNSSVKTANYSTTLSSKNNGRYVRCIITDKYGNKVTSDSASMKSK